MNPEGKFPSQRAEDHPRTEEKDIEKEPLLPGLEVKQEESDILMPPERHDGEIEKYVHDNNFESIFGGAKEQLISVLETVKDDEKAVEFIHQTLKSIFRYIETIYTMETQMKLLGFRLEGDDYKERVSKYDSSRRRAHDALISNLLATTRYLNENYAGKIPETGIYNGNRVDLIQKNRHSIGDWAIEVEHEILLARNK